MEPYLKVICVLGVLSTLIGHSFTATVREKTWTKVIGNNYGSVRLGPAWTDLSTTSCALNCWTTYAVNCHTIMYNENTGLCTPGSFLKSGAAGSSLAPSSTEGELYATSSCDISNGFTYVSSGGLSACIWASDFAANYDDATQHCANLGSHLFVAHDVDKLQLMPAGEWRMIGMTDIAQEGVYKWIDTGEAISPAYFIDFWMVGDPNNAGGVEHCVAFEAGKGPTGVDFNCALNFAKFVCERPMYIR